MAATTAPPDGRIETLDIVRGVAVMGILAMNVVGFALPSSAYMNPVVAGIEGSADWIAWAFGFLFVDGKMRGLFGLLFGASMLLVIERAEAAGGSGAATHFRRMAWLLVFGLVHFYLIWQGDILTLYAGIGMLAFLFWRKGPAALLGWAVALLVLQLAVSGLAAFGFFAVAGALAGPHPDPQAAALWTEMTSGFGLAPGEVARELTLYRGSYADILGYRTGELASWPFLALFVYGAETLGYFLLGMWALKTGLLAGSWPARRYLHLAAAGFAVSLPIYALLAYWQWASGFRVEVIYAATFTLPILPRTLMVLAIAALVIICTRGNGALTARIAAAGRAAFTNYLGTSLVLTTLFYGYGFGLFGQLSRAQLWGVVVACWAMMLLWSKPWLDRFAYGPLEWLWRSLSRGRLQPMRRGGRRMPGG